MGEAAAIAAPPVIARLAAAVPMKIATSAKISRVTLGLGFVAAAQRGIRQSMYEILAGNFYLFVVAEKVGYVWAR